MLRNLVGFHPVILIGTERKLGGKHAENLHLQALVVGAVLCYYRATVPDHVGYVHSYALTNQCVTAFLVYHGTLLVHHVIILQQALTDTEVVLLNLLLSLLYALGDEAVLNHLILLKTQFVHERSDTVRSEQTHQVILK